MKSPFVYIMGSASGTLYVGVTSDLEKRVWEHRNGEHDGFTKRYRITKLLYMEEHSRMDDAIAREKQVKAWGREKKLALIRTNNPRWNDLAWDWFTGARDKSERGMIECGEGASRRDFSQARNDGCRMYRPDYRMTFL